MAANELPPVEFLRECFTIKGGEVVWLERPEKHFVSDLRCRQWNTKYAGTSGALAGYGYRVFRLTYLGESVKLAAHRVAYAIYEGICRFGEIDHVNGDPSDNRRENLRVATRGQNNANRRGYTKSGLPKGVSARRGRFAAVAAAGAGRTANLGTYDTPEQAHAAYCDFAAKRHGAFFCAG